MYDTTLSRVQAPARPSWLRLSFFFVSLVIGLLVTSTASATVRVVATVPDLGAIAREIGGSLVDVTVLAAPSEDPHFVDARPSHVVALNRADVLLAVGAELETGWLPTLQQQARNPAISQTGSGYLECSNYVQLVEQGNQNRAEGDVHPSGNPHYYFSAADMVPVVRAIGGILSQVDPGHRTTYEANTERLASQVEALAVSQAARFAALPAEARQVVPYHRSQSYLIGWLGLTVPIEVEPLPGIPPNPAHVSRVLSTMRSTGTRVIVQEEFYPTSTSETLAQMVGGQVVIMHGGTDFTAGETYIEHITELCDALYAALTH